MGSSSELVLQVLLLLERLGFPMTTTGSGISTLTGGWSSLLVDELEESFLVTGSLGGITGSLGFSASSSEEEEYGGIFFSRLDSFDEEHNFGDFLASFCFSSLSNGVMFKHHIIS